jgi:hypothetical protein
LFAWWVLAPRPRDHRTAPGLRRNRGSKKQLRLVISLDLIVRSIAVEMGVVDLQPIA